MPNLFGADIAGEIYSAFKGQLVAGTLTKRTAGVRTPGALTGGTNPSNVVHTFEGFIDNIAEVSVAGTLATVTGEFVSILTKSISPAAIPQKGDIILIESIRYTIVEIVERDPAGALYKCRVEK